MFFHALKNYQKLKNITKYCQKLKTLKLTIKGGT